MDVEDDDDDDDECDGGNDVVDNVHDEAGGA